MVNFKQKLILFIVLFNIILFPHIKTWGNMNKNLHKYKLIIISQRKVKKVLTVELANTPKSRTYGLMNRKKLKKNSGMYFVFKSEKYLNFWMKNVTIPLSIAFIDKNGVIKEIQKMKPLDTSVLYPSKYPVKYALEVNQGWFEKNKIKAGSKVYLNGRIGK